MKAIGSPQLREAIRQWLVGKNDLAGRKNIRKHLEEGQGVHEMIQKVLGVQTWKQAWAERLKARAEARIAAKGAPKAKAKVQAKKSASREARVKVAA